MSDTPEARAERARQDEEARRERGGDDTPQARWQRMREEDPVAFAMNNWALFPQIEYAPHYQVIPAGFFPFESPLVKGARAEAGDDPHSVPEAWRGTIDRLILGLGPDQPLGEQVAPMVPVGQGHPPPPGTAAQPAAPPPGGPPPAGSQPAGPPTPRSRA